MVLPATLAMSQCIRRRDVTFQSESVDPLDMAANPTTRDNGVSPGVVHCPEEVTVIERR